MNYLILLLFLIIFIISLYFLIRLRSRQDLVINKSTFIAVSLITGSSAVGLAVSLNIQDPIDSAKLNDTRKNFQNVFLDRDNYKSKIQCHSTVPFDSLTKSVDSLMKYKPQYNSSARSQFNFICMELAYNDQTAIQKIEVLKTAKIDKISPSGELYQIYSLGSNYTDLQRDNMTKELKDKIVQWTLPVFEVSKLSENKYKIQTDSGTLFGTKYVGTFTVVYTQNENEVRFIENLKTGSNITIKGIINDTFMRNIEIEPAILIIK